MGADHKYSTDMAQINLALQLKHATASSWNNWNVRTLLAEHGAGHHTPSCMQTHQLCIPQQPTIITLHWRVNCTY